MAIEDGPLTKHKRLRNLQGQLEQERNLVEPEWRSLAQHIKPQRTRFFVGESKHLADRNAKIIDSTATFSARTLRSGMLSGITSPARPWYRLTTPDPDLAESTNVKNWLHTVQQRMNTVMLQSNLYKVLPLLYGDMGVFATGAVSIEEDDEKVIHCRSFPIGSFWIANDANDRVRVFSRRFEMRVRQIVEKFGKFKAGPGGTKMLDDSNLSQTVIDAWNEHRTEQKIEVLHIISPNSDYNPMMLASKYKRFGECYLEYGANEEKFLWEKGYDEFPVLAGRWEVTGEDPYGTDCPGMTALGDIKQLQHGEKRGAQALDKLVSPPMSGPMGLRNAAPSLLPAAITYYNAPAAGNKFEPLYQLDPHIDKLEQKQQQKRLLIQRAFYEDLFLMLAQSDRREITAREIDERHEEKLLALGEVLEQLNQDVLNPLIDRLFNIMLRRGLIPQPPQELSGQTLRVEYISIMAQAQKLVGIGGMDRLAGFVIQLASVDATAIDAVNTDNFIAEYHEASGVAPRVLRTPEELAAIRAQRAKDQQARAAAENMKVAAQGAQALSNARTDTPSALTALIGA